jgi:tRNA1Val (adenine37-N6)-methyltransferase
MEESVFKFKQFSLEQGDKVMKIGTDGILLGAWVNTQNVSRVLDIGTGTGLIATMIAQRTQETLIHGVEIDDVSFVLAQRNMENCPWSDRLRVFHQAIQEYSVSPGKEYDLIVSNPPFFSGGTFSDNQNRNLVRHTVKMSHSDLLRSAYRLLSKQGRMGLILPYIEGLRFIEMAERYMFHCTRITEVKSRPEKPVERLLIELAKNNKDELKKQLLIIHENDEEFSKSYKDLTRDFYLYL